MATTAGSIGTHAAASGMVWRHVVADYVSLTKPRIIELLLVTTVPAMLLAARGWPPVSLVLATVVGGALVSGSAHATNMVIDRDIDGAMRRTAHRPMPSGRITPRAATVFAAVLLVAGSAVLLWRAGWLPALLTVGAWAWYVGIYTCWLKRRSVQNIVIGGVAGAAPPVIGWAAVTGRVGAPAVVLFLVVVMWTPTHFWALAIGTGGDYADAGVPMLPVTRGPKVAARHGLGYAVATVSVSLVLPATAAGGVLLVAAILLLGAAFVWRAALLVVDPAPARAWRTFHTSNAYLALLFVAVGVAGVLG